MSALCLAACASPQSVEQDAHRVVGDPNFVTVEYGGDPEHARLFAEQYCATYGKKAQLKTTKLHHSGRYAAGVDVIFNCVAPS